MDRFALAHASGIEPDALIAECIAQLGVLPDTASLGFLYLTDALAPRLEKLLEGLREQTGVPHWIGTVGMAICVTGHEYYDAPALCVLVGDFPPDSFRLLTQMDDAPTHFMKLHGTWLQENGDLTGLIHGNPGNSRTPQLIHALSEALPKLRLFGGLSSGQGEPYQVADLVVSKGISGVLFGKAQDVVTVHTQGCSPIGPQRRITRSERNFVIELDHQPALQILKHDIGEVLSRDIHRIGGYIFAGFPVQNSDENDYLIRNILGIDQSRQIIALGADAREGEKLVFCRRDGNTARADLERMLGDIRPHMNRKPRGALYVSCVGRGRYQFGDDSAELGIIRDTLGDLPLVGFFANGEIFRNHLYGFTGVLTLFF